MEYVTVVFAEDRQVYIDGQASGRTNQTLQVETGTHTFKLGDPQDYRPSSRTLVVQDTTNIDPMEVTFAKV
jgi:hypothetical protein